MNKSRCLSEKALKEYAANNEFKKKIVQWKTGILKLLQTYRHSNESQDSWKREL